MQLGEFVIHVTYALQLLSHNRAERIIHFSSTLNRKLIYVKGKIIKVCHYTAQKIVFA